MSFPYNFLLYHLGRDKSLIFKIRFIELQFILFSVKFHINLHEICLFYETKTFHCLSSTRKLRAIRRQLRGYLTQVQNEDTKTVDGDYIYKYFSLSS